MKPPQGPPQKPENNEKQEPIMTFEQFAYRPDHYRGAGRNNFWLRFSLSPDSFYANKDYVKRFRKEYPEKYESICNKKDLKGKSDPSLFDKKDPTPFLEKLDRSNQKNEQLEKELDRESYEAYKIMRGYGFTDHDLCG